jgi:hypothetical protein
MNERNATSEQNTHIDRFAVYSIPDTQISCLHFESTSDLGVVISKSELSDSTIDHTEGQVLVRLGVDDEDYAIVYVDTPLAEGSDDAGTIDRAIEMLEVARRQLRAMSGRTTS